MSVLWCWCAGVMVKRGMDVSECEIFRFYKLVTLKGLVEPISMIVPRRGEQNNQIRRFSEWNNHVKWVYSKSLWEEQTENHAIMHWIIKPSVMFSDVLCVLHIICVRCSLRRIRRIFSHDGGHRISPVGRWVAQWDWQRWRLHLYVS